MESDDPELSDADMLVACKGILQDPELPKMMKGHRVSFTYLLDSALEVYVARNLRSSRPTPLKKVKTMYVVCLPSLLSRIMLSRLEERSYYLMIDIMLRTSLMWQVTAKVICLFSHAPSAPY